MSVRPNVLYKFICVQMKITRKQFTVQRQHNKIKMENFYSNKHLFTFLNSTVTSFRLCLEDYSKIHLSYQYSWQLNYSCNIFVFRDIVV